MEGIGALSNGTDCVGSVTPRNAVLWKNGRSHYDNFSDAVHEPVDNSINALFKQIGPKVSPGPDTGGGCLEIGPLLIQAHVLACSCFR